MKLEQNLVEFGFFRIPAYNTYTDYRLYLRERYKREGQVHGSLIHNDFLVVTRHFVLAADILKLVHLYD